ncbi:MAG: Thiol-disulfide isomerase or thioredoxin [Acidobacteria bacterium]|nr:Thiol-disulfide isomerase or thioredoxin [Acidobacteriota bacterium]
MKKSTLAFSVFSLLCSCSSRQAVDTGPLSVISGKISGFGNKAPAMARVDIYEPDGSDVPRRLPASSDGSFSVATSKTGVVRLSFTGVQHSPYMVSLLLQEPVRMNLDVRLAPFEWVSEFREIMVIGDFNRWSRNNGYVIMVKQRDGTHAAELGNLPGGKMGYRLVGLVKGSTRSVPGTQFDDLGTDPAGNFVSQLAVRGGKARIVFDPAALPRSAVKAGVTFADSTTQVARVAVLDLEMRSRQEDYSRALSEFAAFGRKRRDFHYDWSRTTAALRRQLESETDPMVRQMLFLGLLDLKHLRAEGIDTEFAKQALATIPPDSPLWGLAPNYLLYESIEFAGGLGAQETYFQAVVTGHPSREVRALVLEQAYADAKSALDLDRARAYYKRLTSEFGDLAPGQRVKSRPPELRIAAGKVMPEFSFTSLDDTFKTINNGTLQGKNYLINFWATWRAPCVAAMESLHRIHERFKKNGFEIVSLSFDAVPEDIEKFRAGKWKMPWIHGLFGMDEFRAGSYTTDYFEVPEIPKSILVDRSGRILAVFGDSPGATLENEIGRLIGQ